MDGAREAEVWTVLLSLARNDGRCVIARATAEPVAA